MAKYAQTFLDYPPMQKGASFNLERLKEEREWMRLGAGGPSSACACTMHRDLAELVVVHVAIGDLPTSRSSSDQRPHKVRLRLRL